MVAADDHLPKYSFIVWIHYCLKYCMSAFTKYLTIIFHNKISAYIYICIIYITNTHEYITKYKDIQKTHLRHWKVGILRAQWTDRKSNLDADSQM